MPSDFKKSPNLVTLFVASFSVSLSLSHTHNPSHPLPYASSPTQALAPAPTSIANTHTLSLSIARAWSSSDKEETLACHITSPFNNKLSCFQNKIKKIALENNLFLWMGKLSGKAVTQLNLKSSHHCSHSLALSHCLFFSLWAVFTTFEMIFWTQKSIFWFFKRPLAVLDRKRFFNCKKLFFKISFSSLDRWCSRLGFKTNFC